MAAINLLTKSHSERQSFDSNHGICFKRPHSYWPLSESFWEKVVKKTAQKQKEIVGAVPRESLLALGRYLNQMFTIQGNYKNRARIRLPSERILLDKKAYVETVLWIVSLFSTIFLKYNSEL